MVPSSSMYFSGGNETGAFLALCVIVTVVSAGVAGIADLALVEFGSATPLQVVALARLAEETS